MERGSSKHGPRVDEQLKAEVEGLERSGRPTRVEEWRETEPYEAPRAGWAEPQGVPAADLADDDLLRELQSLHDTRNLTFRHGSADALTRHSERTRELEAEYLRRRPGREVDPERLRSGARRRGGS